MSCAVCGAGSPRGKLVVRGVPILECPRCGLAWWQPAADFRPRELYGAAYFGDPAAAQGYDDYGALESSLRANFARRIARLPRPAGIRAPRLLDVGAAYGFAVAEAAALGWSAWGLELSPDAAARAAERVPGRLLVGDAARLPFAGGGFEAVTLWDVLEHLPDPHAAVAEVARVLRPGGRLVLTTGDVGSAVARVSGRRWHLFNLPEHLFFYTRRSLRRLLEAHGLRLESLRTEPSFYTLAYLVERLRKGLLGRPGRGTPRWPGARLCVPLNLFDIVTARAVRAGAP